MRSLHFHIPTTLPYLYSTASARYPSISGSPWWLRATCCILLLRSWCWPSVREWLALPWIPAPWVAECTCSRYFHSFCHEFHVDNRYVVHVFIPFSCLRGCSWSMCFLLRCMSWPWDKFSIFCITSKHTRKHNPIAPPGYISWYDV